MITCRTSLKGFFVYNDRGNNRNIAKTAKTYTIDSENLEKH